MATDAAAPEVNTQVRFLEPGWRFWRFGQWHTVKKMQAGRPGTAYILTDDGRAFHAGMNVFIAAEQPERAAP